MNTSDFCCGETEDLFRSLSFTRGFCPEWESVIESPYSRRDFQFSSVQSLSRVRLFATPWIFFSCLAFIPYPDHFLWRTILSSLSDHLAGGGRIPEETTFELILYLSLDLTKKGDLFSNGVKSAKMETWTHLRTHRFWERMHCGIKQVQKWRFGLETHWMHGIHCGLDNSGNLS